MKKIYFILFMGICLMSFGQEGQDMRPPQANEISGFKLYPNPATSDVVYITTDSNAHKEIKIYDVFGELVLTDRISNKILNISRLSPGVYMVQVSEHNSTINRKLVVK
jgi:hypothetical protein